MKFKSYPKVNIFLIIGKKNKKKNLHKIKSLFFLVKNSFFDEVEINYSDKNNISYFYNNKRIFIENCIFQKTIKLLKEKSIIDKNIFFEIKVKKNIPIGSGLGGGSSNVACLIEFLVKNKKIKLSKKVKEIILSIGSDVMFFVKKNELSFVYGYGEKTIKIFKKNISVLLYINPIECLTKKVFNEYENINIKTASTLKQLYYFKNKKYNLLVNDLEECCFSVYPELRKIKEKLESENKEKKVFLSGSGSTFFIIE